MIPPRKPHIVGRPFARVEGQAKLAGAAHYLDDVDFGADLLYARIVSSTRPHALLRAVDVSPALALAGVHIALTGQDIRGQLGLHLQDRPVLAQDRVRFVGEPVAVVAAESPELAEQAARLVAVTYEDLPGVFTVETALAADAPVLHPDLASSIRAPFIQPQPNTNLAHRCQMQRGDLEREWREAHVVIEQRYYAPPVHHVALEPHGAVAQMETDGRVTLWASTQAPFVQREMIAQALGLNSDRLRVVTPYVGGGFGGKAFVSIEALAVALALQAGGRPVKLVLNREEEFTSTFVRPGLTAHIKMGANRQGHITALEATYQWDAGAAADAIIELAWGAAYAGAGPYDVPNAQIESCVVYTNHVPAAPMRGNGMAEIHWAVEQHIDRLAEALDMDAVTFRLLNCLKGGDVLLDGQIMHATGLDQCIRQAAAAIRWSKAPAKPTSKHRRRGKGLAAMWNPVFWGNQTEATAVVRLDEDGPVVIEMGGVDVGQGFYTVAAQLVASALGVPLEWVRVSAVDTDHSPEQWQAMTSQLTWSSGNAALRAAQTLRANILMLAVEAWGEPIGSLDIAEGVVFSYASDRTLALTDLVTHGIDLPSGKHISGHLRATGSFQPKSPAHARTSEHPLLPVMHFSTGAQAVEVEVDIETGEVEIIHIASAFDVGRAINPDIVEAQIKGGSIQGMSTALFEQVLFEDGQPRNAGFLDYRIATAMDLPQSVEAAIVEVPQDDGPFGARGVGEHSIIASAPAIGIAIHRAVGVRLTDLPITSERVWEGLQAQHVAQLATVPTG